jgi:hypothetical protein
MGSSACILAEVYGMGLGGREANTGCGEGASGNPAALAKSDRPACDRHQAGVSSGSD